MLKNFFRVMLYFFGFFAVGVVAVSLVFKIVNYEKNVKVPLLVGKSVPAASELLNEKGLFLKVQGEEYDVKISLGLIIRQDIKEGRDVEKGEVVNVFVSKGAAMFAMPYLEGMNINDVKLTLMRSSIDIGKITRVHSDTVEKNNVIAQRPLQGYSSENKVNLLVSLGPYDVFYQCPSFVNMTADEARRVASALGLELIEQKSGSLVVFQKPEAGTIIKKGDSVEVTLGRGWGLWF